MLSPMFPSRALLSSEAVLHFPRELPESEDFVRLLLEHAHDSIHIVDENGVSVFDTASRTGILGFEGTEVIGRNNYHLVHEDDRDAAIAAVEQIFREGRAGPIEYRIRHKDGSWRTYESIGRRYTAEDGRRLAIINTRETTERHRVRAEMQALEEQLRHAQKLEAIGRLAGGIAHDFNNLLAVILGYAERLGDHLPAEGEPRQDLQEIIKAGNRAAALTRQLLAYGRKQALNPRSVDINSIVRDTVGMLTPLLGPAIDLRTDLADAPCIASVDAPALQQVLVNLAVNARDAMPAGGRIAIGTTLVRLERGALPTGYPPESGSFVRLTCADTGTGMSPDVVSRIFEPFFTTKAEGEGSGLGLPMAYGIVKQLQGEVVVESRPGQGTTFSIYLLHGSVQGALRR
jgi:two-component system, cell cycle sensor histidine kinase and response regulator CckA